jgi:hypothetical protein
METTESVQVRFEAAIGGEYQMPDGRGFWIGGPVAREIAVRIVRAGFRFDEPGPRDRLFDAVTGQETTFGEVIAEIVGKVVGKEDTDEVRELPDWDPREGASGGVGALDLTSDLLAEAACAIYGYENDDLVRRLRNESKFMQDAWDSFEKARRDADEPADRLVDAFEEANPITLATVRDAQAAADRGVGALDLPSVDRLAEVRRDGNRVVLDLGQTLTNSGYDPLQGFEDGQAVHLEISKLTELALEAQNLHPESPVHRGEAADPGGAGKPGTPTPDPTMSSPAGSSSDPVGHRRQILLEVETMINGMRLAEPTDVDHEARLLVRSTYADILDAVAKMDEDAGHPVAAKRHVWLPSSENVVLADDEGSIDDLPLVEMSNQLFAGADFREVQPGADLDPVGRRPVTWRELIREMTDETILASDGDLDLAFDATMDAPRLNDPMLFESPCIHFTAWTESWVLSPRSDDLTLWIGKARRNPPKGSPKEGSDS